MNETFEKTADEAAAFQKICVESMSKLMQAAFTFTPSSPPPEILRQIRSGIFQTLSQSWEEFMRSPEFLEGMKQWMENAVAFRKLTNEFMGRTRNEVQAPSRNDVDTILVAVRHLEQRLLDRMEELSSRVASMEQRTGRSNGPGSAPEQAGAKPGRRRARARKKATKG